MSAVCRKPCPTCPWRKDQHAQSIPNFSLELAENLIHTTITVIDAPIFACHQSKPEQEVICVGWLWRYGWDNIQIRLKLIHKQMRREELEPDPSFDNLLHSSFDEVITKLRADCNESS